MTENMKITESDLTLGKKLRVLDEVLKDFPTLELIIRHNNRQFTVDITAYTGGPAITILHSAGETMTHAVSLLFIEALRNDQEFVSRLEEKTASNLPSQKSIANLSRTLGKIESWLCYSAPEGHMVFHLNRHGSGFNGLFMKDHYYGANKGRDLSTGRKGEGTRLIEAMENAAVVAEFLTPKPEVPRVSPAGVLSTRVEHNDKP